MREDFDWEYANMNKKTRLSQFCDAIEALDRGRPTMIAEWYGHAIFDLEKTAPYIKEYGDIILGFCDECHYWGDAGDEDMRRLTREGLVE